MPTIRDVARYAKVSVATVSRYLNKSPLISEASAQRVKEAIEALDYQPNMLARGLLHGNTKTIALAIDDTNVETYGNDYFLKIQYGIEHELARNGYYLIICHIGNGDISLLESIIKEKRIDGVILLKELAQPAVIELLEKAGIPFVLTGQSKSPSDSWVDIDNVEAGYRATKYLISRGNIKIGFLTNSFDKVFNMERFEGYKAALSEAGGMFNTGYIKDGMDTASDVESYVTEKRSQVCDAYIASDSRIAFYLSRYLAREGIKVPDTVQIVGFDDSILAEISEPAMTVIQIDVMNLGATTARALIQQIQHPSSEPIQILLPINLIERGSTMSR